MLANYLKVAWKVLARRRFFTFVSLFGIGFTLMVLLVVAAAIDFQLVERGAERPLRGALYLTSMVMKGDDYMWSSGPGWKFLDRYARDLPGVARSTFFATEDDIANYLEGEKVISKLRSTDAAYWDVFDFRFLEGAPFTAEDVREERPVVVISESTRRRFFDDAPAVGRDFDIDGRNFRVVGVVEDVPGTQMMAFADVWRPHTTILMDGWHDALMGDCVAVFVPERGAAVSQIQAEFQSRLARVEFDKPDRFHTMVGLLESRLGLVARNFMWVEPGKSAVGQAAVAILGGALLFMLLPAINLVSINLSRIYERSGEIGVRKAFGASSADLVWQFILENVVLCLIGSLVALVAAAFVLELVEGLVPVPHVDLHLNWRLFLAGVVLAVLFGILSGAWPAFKMSRQHPVLALRGGAR
jgi:putative ABC transport system permease protein